MQIDRIVTDILSFINRWLWWQAGEVDERPFVPVGRSMRGTIGILQRIKRNPLPGEPVDRYCDYWRFMPYAYGHNRTDRKDIHVTCSYIGAVEGERRRKGVRSRSIEPTHQIDVIEASHWINKRTGTWDGRQIYTEKVDLFGKRSEITRAPIPPSVRKSMPWANFTRDGFAIMVCASLAAELLTKEAWQIQWEDEVEAARRAIMGSAYTPKPKKDSKSTFPPETRESDWWMG